MKDGIKYSCSGDGPEQFTMGTNLAREWQRKLPGTSRFKWSITLTVVDATQAARMDEVRSKTKSMFDADGKPATGKPKRGAKAAKNVTPRLLTDQRRSHKRKEKPSEPAPVDSSATSAE